MTNKNFRGSDRDLKTKVFLVHCRDCDARKMQSVEKVLTVKVLDCKSESVLSFKIFKVFLLLLKCLGR